MRHRQTDVLIIGGGLSGMMAAKHLVDRSPLRPLIVADGQGASPWVHGFNVPIGPGDSAEAFYQDTMVSGHGVNRPELARALCNSAISCFEELQALGLRFNRQGDGYQLLRPLGSSHPRVVSVGNETGPAILAVLRASLTGRADWMAHGRALRLRVEDGRVTGALVYDAAASEWLTIAAGAVILACGGFCGIYPFSTNKRDSGGDGVAMALEAGCRLTDMEFIQFEPSAAVWPAPLRGTSVITTMFYEGAVLRDRDSRRFMLERDPAQGERVNKDVMTREIARIIRDGRGTAHGGVYFDATAMDARRLREDYAAYVARYARVDVDITREMMEIAPAPHTALGGVVITQEARTDIPGLYACGEVTGGLHGADRLGGSAGLETLAFGRRAGESCAEDTLLPPRETTGWDAWARRILAAPGAPADAQALRARMGRALAEGAGALRTGEGLRAALAELRAVRREAEAMGGEAFTRLRLLNDLTAAELVCRGAYERRESVGCHTRLDHGEAAGRPYRLIQSRAGCVREDA